MARTAELYDGTELQFPDGTPDEVIERAAARETDRLRTEDARRPLPEGTSPSSAGAGRGKAQPPRDGPPPPPAPAATPQPDPLEARTGAASPEDHGVAVVPDTQPFFKRGGSVLDGVQVGDYAPKRLTDADLAENVRLSRAPHVLAQEAAIAAAPRLSSGEGTILPTGGAMEAAKRAPGMAARGLAESALTVGAVLADYGIQVPGGPNAREFRRAAAPLKRENRAAALGLSDEALVNLGPTITAIVPSARTLGEGLSEVGRQIALNAVLPGGIIVDAGFKGVDEAQMAGMSPGAALVVGVLKAGTEGVPEHFSTKFGLKQGAELKLRDALTDPRVMTDAAKRFGKAMGVELTSEQASAVSNFMVDRLTLDQTATLDRLGADMADAVKSTLVQAPGMVAAGKIGATLESAGRKISAWDIAGQRGFHVDPPLATESPADQVAKRIGAFDQLATQVGMPQKARDMARKAAEQLPADKVGPFLAAVASAYEKRGIAKPADPIIKEAIAAPAVQPAQEVDPDEAPNDQAAAAAPAVAVAADARVPAAVAVESGAAGVPGGEGGAARSVAAPAQADDFTGLSETDVAAHAAATSQKNALPEPTDGQKEAGNYQKGHLRVAGLDISIENPEGSTRRSKPGAKTPWESTMTSAHYGYVRGTKGMDGEHIDTFVKPGTAADFAGTVFIIDQQDPATGKPDEHKVMLGYDSPAEAMTAYRANYEPGWKGARGISAAPMAEFKAWLEHGDTSKPFIPELYRGSPPEGSRAPGAAPPAGAARGSDRPAGGQRAADVQPAAAPGGPAGAPAAGGVAAVAVPAPGGGAGAVGPRVIARVGAMPKTATPVDLRANADGTLTPWHEGRELLDYDSGEPIKVPANATNQQALKAIKDAGALGRRQKVFGAEKELPKETPADQVEEESARPLRRGKVGDKLGSGEVVLTAGGRQTTPFPKVKVDTERKATATVKAVDRWLMQNAIAEAEARGDDFNAGQFRAQLERPSQADKDAAEEYLFGEQPAVQPSILKPLAPAKPVEKPEAAPAPRTAIAKPDVLVVTMGGKSYRVDSIEDAQRKWIAFQEAAGAGVSEVGNGVRVTDGDGNFVARISFNGRAWADEDTVANPRLLAEAPARASAAPAEQLTDEKALAHDYAALEGRQIEQQVLVEDTGETATLRMDAARALRDADARLAALRALQDCLKGKA